MFYKYIGKLLMESSALWPT